MSSLYDICGCETKLNYHLHEGAYYDALLDLRYEIEQEMREIKKKKTTQQLKMIFKHLDISRGNFTDQ